MNATYCRSPQPNSKCRNYSRNNQKTYEIIFEGFSDGKNELSLKLLS